MNSLLVVRCSITPSIVLYLPNRRRATLRPTYWIEGRYSQPPMMQACTNYYLVRDWRIARFLSVLSLSFTLKDSYENTCPYPLKFNLVISVGHPYAIRSESSLMAKSATFSLTRYASCASAS